MREKSRLLSTLNAPSVLKNLRNVLKCCRKAAISVADFQTEMQSSFLLVLTKLHQLKKYYFCIFMATIYLLAAQRRRGNRYQSRKGHMRAKENESHHNYCLIQCFYSCSIMSAEHLDKDEAE